MKNRRHRIWIGLHTGIAILLAVVMILMVNYLSYRHYHRIDVSANKTYTLSEKTTGLLDSLETPIEITVFFQPGHVLYEDIQNLLREYQFHSDKLRISWVDPDRDLAMTKKMAVKYKVTELNVVVFECEGRTEYQRADEFAQIDGSTGVERIRQFRGEQAFSSAIQGVVQQTSPVVYFLTGHGERNLESFDQRKGFSKIRQVIEQDNVTVQKLELSVEKQIPADCDALIVAGASQKMSETEAGLIGAWIKRGGRLMILADAAQQTGLETLLLEWGVRLRNDVVVDLDRTLSGRDVFVSAYTQHPITEKLSTTAAIFNLPRSVEPDEQNKSADRPQVTPLAFSSETSWSESQTDQNSARSDATSGRIKGPISMAVAVEKGATGGQLNMQIRPTRLVVFGDSGFVSNGGLTGGDISLFMSAFNWLLERQELLAISPKERADTRLQLTKTDADRLFLITVVGIPSLAALLGIILWLRRRK